MSEKTMDNKIGKINDLDINDIYKFMDLFFDRYMIIYKHLYESFNKFLDEYIKLYLENGDHTFFEQFTKDKIIKYKFKYENISFKKPILDNSEPMFPSDARNRNLTYKGRLLAKVTQIQEIIDITTNEIKINIVGHPEENIPIADIPIMLRSKFCNLTTHKDYNQKECEMDPGGYFIVNGSEKVVISQDRMCDNKPLVFIRKDSGIEIYTVQVNSKSYKPHGITQIINIRMKKDGIMTIRVPILNEIPVFMLFRALGIETDRDIIDYIVYDKENVDMIDVIRISLENCINDKGVKVQTKQDAYDYLVNKIRVIKKYTESDKKTKSEQKKLHLEDLLKNNLLPHIEGNLKVKAMYFGYMINKLLKCYMGKSKPDDRDSYLNKRIDLPGDLLMELFKQFYRKMLNECNKFFRKRNTNDNEPLVIINQIKPNIIEQGIKASLLTGAWPRKKGVAQMLQRFTYLQTISFLRRVDSPGGDASSSKLTSPRNLHLSSASFLCCLTGDAEILLSDGSIKLIKHMNESDKVMTVYKDTLREEISNIKNYFNKITKDLIEINILTNNKLKCTLDHPILIRKDNKFIMVESGELKVNDEIIVRHTQKYLDYNNEKSYDKLIIKNIENIDNKHLLELNNLNLLNKELNQNQCEILARLSGYIDYDNLKQNIIYIEHERDIINLENDILNLGFSKPYSVKKNNIYELHISDTLVILLSNISGFLKYNNENIIYLPKWIKNGNLRVKREYLCGFMSKINKMGLLNIYNTNNNYYNLEIFKITKIVNKNNLDIVNNYLLNIIQLFNDLNIIAKIDKKNINGKYEFNINFANTLDNLINYMDNIDNRYNYTKNINNRKIIEYIKYIKYNQNNLINYNEFIKKYYITEDKFAIPIKNINNIKPEIVYDFETELDSHSFIVNGIITSNCVSTPEHAKVGLTKHLSLIASITITHNDMIHILRSYFAKNIIDINDVPAMKLKELTKVFLNGDWVGLSDNPFKMEAEMKKFKLNGTFEPTTSIVHDIPEREIRVYCDGGRIYRPIMIVENNEVKLNKNIINNTSINKAEKNNKITSWNEFLLKHPGIIEYIDMEEQPYLMIAEYINKVEKERVKMIKSIDKVKNIKNNVVDNRYDDMMFVNYTHCEFHASFLLGEIPTNIPFCNHNAGPRNIFQYAQGRQAMGIYISNYRDRLDISYILYHPQKPLITTRTAKYLYTDVLPSGENAIVAIMVYTGYNQEDSLVFNLSALDRGLFRSTNLKKHIAAIQKNQSTSQDDIFIKPDPTKVTGMRHGSYEKLNDKGYVPEETKIENGDIIIGKVSPIQPIGNSNKTFKDNSEVYRGHASAVIDKVYTNIYNSDGYEMRKVRTRSDRKPRPGDKFCIPENAKTQVLTYNGWKLINEINKDDLIATLDNNKIKYSKSIDIYSWDYEGDIYKVRSEYVDLDVTIDHELYIKKEGFDKYELVSAKDIKYNYNLKKNCENDNNYENINNLEIGNKIINYKDLLEFIGIFIINGHVYNNKIYIRKNGENMFKTLDRICKNMNIPIYTHINNYIIYDLEFIKYLESINSDFIWKLNLEQSRILLNGIMNNEDYINNISYELADYILRLSIHCGWSGLVVNNNNNYSIRILKGDIYNEPEINKSNIETYYYKGKVYCLQVPSHIFMIKQNNKNVWIGNCSRHGQKGTIGIQLKQSNMPFTKDGIVPDICLNPHAIPSRMTVAQLVETLVGKKVALEGSEADGTPFNEIDLESVKNALEKLGYERNGYEYLYNGMTGEKLKVMICIGPTYYQRLKHQVEDKIHSRSRGPRTLLTRQPPEGRSRDGGLRLGEMERDAVLAHGMALFLKEKLMDTSDAYSTFICDKCGLFAQRLFRKGNQSHATSKDVYFCPSCKNYTEISKIMIPYAFKLLVQEMMSMDIAARIRVNKDIFGN